MTFFLPTSSTVNITVRGTELDLAFRLDWKESQPRIPIYGYNDYSYTKTIKGRKIIQGYLVMNYVAPHYLTSFLAALEKDGKSKHDSEAEERLNVAANKAARAELITLSMIRERSAAIKSKESKRTTSFKGYGVDLKGGHAVEDASIAHGMSPGKRDVLKKQLLDRYTRGGGKDGQGSPLLTTPFDYSTPFPMEIYHADPEFAPWYVVLEDVEITDISQTVSASGAEGSSEPLYETYEFIARRRIVKKTGRAEGR